ncbi:threonine aldolase family protein [Promicromonospora thailandica]|uniref:L-threonine aldolase n=1 Tax=Promicromonospora thailandica TaxID=765201 RepID=A0A9X2G155_9MICO|nr:beta-eliminating lyase-related protein [Promicromonospora thailandica]MCP2265120.1 L-threonine aldolase [Promicromonospora thailandica]BFF19810.1 low specificity L-threonine aldolase [Promicromonospora thailandica]
MLQLASDNYAPVHPEVMAAVVAANDGAAVSYGDDPVSARLQVRAAEVFGDRARIFPVLNGTGANVVSLMAVTPRWGGVVASDVAHVHTDENGAPERVGGLKLLTVPGTHGRIGPDAVDRWAGDLGDVHRAQPAVLSLTQVTELGTVYSVADLKLLADAAHAAGLRVHMDGSRLANAAATLGVGLREITTDVGVDILSLGAAKNGGMLGEAVVALSDDDGATGPAAAVPYLRKATMQLASKTRFVSAQLLALLGEPGTPTSGAGPEAPLWLRNAEHSNAMAARLRAGLGSAGLTSAESAVRVTRPTEANVVFATLPRAAADRVRADVRFYDWAPGETADRVEVRWMCAWDTTEADVDGFVARVAASL